MIIGRKAIFLLLFFLIGFSLSGQDEFSPKHIIALHLNRLINVDYPALHFSYDYRIAESDAVSIETGFIYDFDANLYKKEEWERGIIGIQTGLAYKKLIKTGSNGYMVLGFKGTHQQTKRRIDDWVWRNQNSYQEKMLYNQRLRKYAFLFLIGNQTRINDKWLFSILFHLGLNQKNFKTDLPPDAEIISEDNFIRINPDVEIDGDYIFPEAHFEISLGRYF